MPDLNDLLTTMSEDINTNDTNIQDNDNDIANNTDSINTNSDTISNNTLSIDENRQAIQELQQPDTHKTSNVDDQKQTIIETVNYYSNKTYQEGREQTVNGSSDAYLKGDHYKKAYICHDYYKSTINTNNYTNTIKAKHYIKSTLVDGITLYNYMSRSILQNYSVGMAIKTYQGMTSSLFMGAALDINASVAMQLRPHNRAILGIKEEWGNTEMKTMLNEYKFCGAEKTAYAKKDELTAVKSEVALQKDQITNATNSISSTQLRLTASEQELQSYKSELTTTVNELSSLRSDVSSIRSDTESVSRKTSSVTMDSSAVTQNSGFCCFW